MADDLVAGPVPEPEEVPKNLRREFLQLGPDDAERLRALAPLFASTAAGFVEQFYAHLYRCEATASFLRDPELVERLKQMQVRHLQGLLSANWGAEFEHDRVRVGQVHAERGLEPQYFLGAYYQYFAHCLQLLLDGRDEAGSALPQVLSLVKAIFYDIGLTLDAYFAQNTQNLREALDLYWHANNELKQFARLASHDLKTPLATVANLCDEALDEFGDQMPEGARELVAAAQERTLRMSTLIDELLSVSVTAHTPDTLDEFSSEEALQEAVERVAPLAVQRGVTLLLPDSCPYVWGNKVRLREAFYNVLTNAVKFIDQPDGQVQVTVTTDGQRCTFCIRDTGSGIPPEELEQVFAPFRRLAQHRHVPGSGLGLYFTKTLIEDQGGRIWVESELGVGSRFYLQLPHEAQGRRHAGSSFR